MQTFYKAADGTEFNERQQCVKYEQQFLKFGYYTKNGDVPENFEDATIIWIGNGGYRNFQKFFEQVGKDLYKPEYEDIDTAGIYFRFTTEEKFIYVEPEELKIMSKFYSEHRNELDI